MRELQIIPPAVLAVEQPQQETQTDEADSGNPEQDRHGPRAVAEITHRAWLPGADTECRAPKQPTARHPFAPSPAHRCPSRRRLPRIQRLETSRSCSSLLLFCLFVELPPTASCRAHLGTGTRIHALATKTLMFPESLEVGSGIMTLPARTHGILLSPPGRAGDCDGRHRDRCLNVRGGPG